MAASVAQAGLVLMAVRHAAFPDTGPLRPGATYLAVLVRALHIVLFFTNAWSQHYDETIKRIYRKTNNVKCIGQTENVEYVSPAGRF